MALTDAEVLAKLQETRDQLIERKLEITAQPKPNYNIDGQDIKWGDYLKQLDASIAAVEDQISRYDDLFEEVTIGHT